MSKVGKLPVAIPAGVTINVANGVISVKGPKGELTQKYHDEIDIKVEGTEVTLERKNDNFKNFHGTANANINNMIIGVSKGYEKGLEAQGVGYRFNVAGTKITISAGYSHPVVMECPKGISVEQVSNTEITLKGIDKQKVNELAANVRKVRQPEPYKGKGIRYKGEYVRRKEGKKAAK